MTILDTICGQVPPILARKALPFAAIILALVSGCAPQPGKGLSSLVPPTQGRDRPLATIDSINDENTDEPRKPIIDTPANPRANGAPVSVARADVTAKGDVTLNFVNADIKNVLQAVLGDILELNYVVNANVQGTITVQTSQPIKRSDVLPTLESVLQANGYSMVQSDGTFQVMPTNMAASAGAQPITSLRSTAGQGGLSTLVMPLRYSSAAQVMKVIEPFVPAGGIVQADASRNLLLISGSRPQIQSVVKLIEIFDVDYLAGTSFALIPLEQGTPSTVTRELTAILDSGPNGPMSGAVRLVPLDRIGSILVASTQPAYLSKIQTWIERLDKGGDDSGSRIYVYHVQNSRAADVAKVMEGMFGEGVQTIAPSTVPGSITTELTGAPLASPAIGVSRSPAPAPGGTTGGSLAPAAGATVTPSNNAGAGPAFPGSSAPSLAGFGSSGRGSGPRIIADEKNNALVIYAQPQQYRMIEAAVKKLDVVPVQVMIEATVAEVTLTDELRYGLQWFFKDGNSALTLSKIASGAVNPVFPGFDYVFATHSARAVLDALSSVTNVHVLSAPQLMVLDHQTATLQVGDEVPIAVQQARSVTNPDSPIVNSIELKSTGVILRVTPRVNSTGMSTLAIEQEVSDVSKTTTSSIDSPTIQQRRISSTVAVSDGDTIALGGLIRENRTLGKNGLPILSDIPLLGNLFGSTSDNTTRTELMILITPHVVRNRADAQAATEELRKRLSDVRLVPNAK